jgi:hypothetical protein
LEQQFMRAAMAVAVLLPREVAAVEALRVAHLELDLMAEASEEPQVLAAAVVVEPVVLVLHPPQRVQVLVAQEA